jgi:predicted ferric reductase
MQLEFQADDDPGLEQRTIALLLLVLFVVSLGAGALVALATRAWAAPVADSLVGPVPKGFWYLSRASGVVAYALVWYSMALGLLITNRLARFWPGGPAAYELHGHVSLLGLAFSVFHALVLLGDPKIDANVVPLLVPFGGIVYRPVWIVMGQVGLYLMAIVALTFYLRRWIGKRTWRAVHSASFLVFGLVLAHGMFSGPDSGQTWAQGMYWFTGASILCLTAYRLIIARLRPARKRKGQVSAPSS